MRSTNGPVGAVAALVLLLMAAPAVSQESGYHDEMAAKIEAKREEIRRHTEAMEAIDDPEALQLEMQRHFRMTEALLGWVVEHQKQRLATAESAETSTAKAGDQATQDSMPMGQGMGTGGCKGEGCGKKQTMGPDGMGKRMGHGGAMTGSKSGHGPGEHGRRGGDAIGSMGGSGDASETAGASAAAARIAEREALLREITTHSLYLEGLDDPAERAREIVEHQQMLDRLMGLMQE